MKKRITFISDTHGLHSHYDNLLDSGDVLIHAGDVSNIGKSTEIYDFLNWFSDVDYTHKVFIAGNHDWGFEVMTEIPEIFRDKNVHYLFDSMVEIDGLKIYGSPWQPEFFDWAFNLPRMGKELEETWDRIPENLDVLVTHGPPWGILDVAPNNLNVDGQKTIDGVEYINAAVLGESYKPKNKPVMIDYDLETKKFDYV